REDMHRIAADLLIPGRGRPVPDGVVVLDGGRISYAGPAAGAPDTPGAVTGQAPTGMPRLWGCHGHFLRAPAPDPARLPPGRRAAPRPGAAAAGAGRAAGGPVRPGSARRA